MKNVGIQHACSEDWNKMTPTEKGAFCQKCAKQVYDFTNKSTNEIKFTLLELRDQEICGRMTLDQERILNAEFEHWIQENKTNFQRLFLTALVIVFGLTLFSCEDERDQRKISDAQTALARIIEEKEAPKEETPTKRVEYAVAPPEIVELEEPIYEVIEEVTEKEILLDDVVITAPYGYEGGYVTSGIMIHDRSYYNYLTETTPTIETDENGVPYPTEFKALAFPNPAVESTTLEIQAPHKERMEINLYDMSGKLIREVYSGKISRGTFQQFIDLNDLTPGLYLVIIQSKDFKETVRVVKN
ncbi:T9SS type A sorting domain-containing protein [Fluviicola sp.]|uniref:T9SS type A sorting domain-containing protein n=1 Tax=Fluviicola sp. TaxID=1917219 RepID=UPI003D2BE2A3